MGTSLALIERDLTLQLPTLAQALPRMSSLSPERLMRTAIMAAEKTPKILECTMQSIVSSTVTAAVIGLEVDGVTGQGFLVPFKDHGVSKCQFMMGYKGYPTIAIRSGLSISSDVVREGEAFDYDTGEGWVKHKPRGDPSKPVIAAWAKLHGKNVAAVVKVLSRQQLNQLRDKSRASDSGFSPWKDENGPGFPAMCEKSAIRRIGRNMPVIAADSGFQRAAALEGAQEGGNLAWLRADGALTIEPIRPTEPALLLEAEPVRFVWTMGDGTDRDFKDPTKWATALAQQLPKIDDAPLQTALDRNVVNLDRILRAGHVDEHQIVMKVFMDRGIYPTPQANLLTGTK